MQDWSGAVNDAIAERVKSSTLRSRRTVKILDATHVEIDGRRLINFASNNYLGLTHHPRVILAFENAGRIAGVGSGAAPLITGHSEFHAAAELALARWKSTESAVLCSSGFAANLAAIQMLATVGTHGGGSVRFLIDKLAHASLIDAVRSVSTGDRVSFRVFPHNHLAKLERLLNTADASILQVVVTESIFSMDGDAADLAGIVELKQKHNFFLLLDEAHGSGVYGKNGAGYAAERGLANAIDLTVVTLSKAIGGSGGAVCGSKSSCEAIVNFGRPYIYSTAISPAIAGGVVAALQVMRDEPDRQARVRTVSQTVRRQLGIEPADSPIIPLIIGDEKRALESANQLMNDGLLVIAVRPPTVPKGTSRLRLTISSEHTDEQIDRLINACRNVIC